jgi:hypothetical protein
MIGSFLSAVALTVCPLGAGAGLIASDVPDDHGGSIALVWQGVGADTGYVERATSSTGPFLRIGTVLLSDGTFTDSAASTGQAFHYRITGSDGEPISGVIGPVVSRASVFRTYRLNMLILLVVFSGFVVGYILLAKRGVGLYIRKIAGLDAIDEAVGRATEMGRKVIYVPGILSIDDIQTIASMPILGHVAKRTAEYGTQLDVPNIEPLTMATAREVVREAYMSAGRPDAYDDEMVHFVTSDQFAYTAALQGLFARERPAASFLIGPFFAESLILAEAGHAAGAIQVAGTAYPSQLPFFVVACDYTLIGEELFAASAYLSREPVMLGSIKGQDLAKVLLVAAGIIGVVMTSLGHDWYAALFNAR